MLPTESPAPRATRDRKRSCGLHGPDPATQSTSSKAKGNSSRKRRKLSHPLRGKLVSLNSTGFQDKTLCNTQKAQSRAYIRTPPQINCPQPQSPLQSVGLVHEEGRTVLWLNEQAESQQSLIQPLLCHRLPSMTLERFLHLQFNEVSKDLAGPAHSASIPALQQQNWCFLGRLSDPGARWWCPDRAMVEQTALGFSLPLGIRQYPGWRCLYPGGDVLQALFVIGGTNWAHRDKN